MTGSLVAFVKRDRMAGQKAAHNARHRRDTCSKQEMNMVGKEGKGVTTRFPLTQHTRQAFNKSIPVDIIVEDKVACDTPDHHVVHRTRCIDPGLSWHEPMVPPRKSGRQEESDNSMDVPYFRPLFPLFPYFRPLFPQ
jgi:hypothetical protein